MNVREHAVGPQWQQSLVGLEFEVSDRGIFEIADPRTRVKALRRYYFPKLNVLLNSARSLISTIYGARSLDTFTEAQRPKPKEGAETITEFNDLHLGLVGVRVQSGLALQGSNGKPVQYGVSHLWFQVTRRGTIAVNFFPMVYGRDPAFAERVSIAFTEHEDAFCAICSAAFVTSDACMSLDTFSASLHPEHLRECAFFSHEAPFPVGPDTGLISLVVTFSALFPFQKLVTDLSMRRSPTIQEDLAALASWWADNGGESVCPGRYQVERALPDAVESIPDWESDSRAMVTGSQRFRILDRDDYRCLACGRTAQAHGVILHIDHIQPRSRGGTDDDTNLQTLCAECNIGKGNRSSRDLRAS